MFETSINNYFGITTERFWQQLLAGAAGAQVIATLKAQASKPLASEDWPIVLSGVAARAKDLLDVDIAWVVVSGWGKYRELMEYAIADRHNPRDTHLVPLSKHTMTVDYNPFLEVRYDGQPLGKVVFDVQLTFDLEGFVLTLQDSKIRKVRTGSCAAQGKIEFAGHCLVEKSLTKIALPNVVNLGEGVDLPCSDSEAFQ
ncbi:MAG: hypothetical protein FJ145_08985 [Deltaproteobacteria bacterium]|nr:hypothetical protein [Deltaproteobacteria bacterium]